jgi:drug/metabolite transporter (DMT)-like permease
MLKWLALTLILAGLVFLLKASTDDQTESDIGLLFGLGAAIADRVGAISD